MMIDKIAYNQFKIGPGGRKCTCCAPPSQILKNYEHRKARQFIARDTKNEINDFKAQKDQDHA